MTILTYEEFRKRYKAEVAPEVREGLKEFHGLDADREVELAFQALYQQYLNEFGIE